MLHVIFIFSDWILIKQIIVSSTPLFLVLRGNRFSKNCTWIFDWGTGARVKMHRFNSFSNVNTINRKNFPTHGGIYKSEKIEQSFWREIRTLRSLTHFSPVSHFYTPWKRQKTTSFLTFLGGYRNVTLD